MTDKIPYAPVLRTQADVEAAWRHLINPLGWPEPRLWFMLVDPDGVPFPQLCQIEGLPVEIADEGAANLATMLPYSEASENSDTPMPATCAVAAVPVDVIHLATDQDFWPVPLDALGELRTPA